jgi:hypothetical protein
MDTATEMSPVITTYVEYLHPGAFFPEESSRAVPERDPGRIARESPDDAFAFRFYDVVTMTVTVGREQVELRGKAIHATGRYYIDAEKLTPADVEALPGDHAILLSNMRGNGWGVILRCRTGNFQPLEAGDVIVSSETGRVDA